MIFQTSAAPSHVARVTLARATVSLPRMRSAAFSAIMMTAAFVLPDTMVGITEASTTRRPSNPLTLTDTQTPFLCHTL